MAELDDDAGPSLTLVLAIAVVVVAILSYAAFQLQDQRPVSRYDILPGTTVTERGLVSAKLEPADVIAEANLPSAHTTVRRVSAPTATLGYVTPWNGAGYDAARLFASKFTHISPVWLQVHGDLTFGGTHDIDAGWMADIRLSHVNETLKILPRVMLERWTQNQVTEMLRDELIQADVIAALVGLCREHDFDGVVLEFLSQIGQNVISHRRQVLAWVGRIGKAFKAEGLTLVIVVPPNPSVIRKEDIEALSEVDYFQVMTYDFSYSGKPGNNAPYKWVREMVSAIAPPEAPPGHRARVLLGINFYGNDYDTTDKSGKTLLGRDYLQLLREEDGMECKWQKRAREHVCRYTDGRGRPHEVYYPSLLSVQERIALAESLGVGIAIWEIGQGLDYFFDLL